MAASSSPTNSQPPHKKTSIGSTIQGVQAHNRPTTASLAVSRNQHRRGLRPVVWQQWSTLSAFAAGLSIAFATFGFTLWLSLQTFSCPEWSLYCEVPGGVAWIAGHLGQIQGIVSAVYGVSMSLIIYTTYKLAETTLWPALAEQDFSLRNINSFFDVSRASVVAIPATLWHAADGGDPYYITALLIVGLVGFLVFVSSIIVGHAYTVIAVTTTLFSNHTIGGGLGLGFWQKNPPGSLPGGVSQAFAVYTAWSNQQSVEPLPEIRDFIVDRANLASIGNVSVNAIRMYQKINCYGYPINITQDLYVEPGTSTYSFWVTPTGLDELKVRFQSLLHTWVDTYTFVTPTRAVTRVIFACINGTIEGGQNSAGSPGMLRFAKENGISFNGIDVLACDVDVDMVDSHLCVGDCSQKTSTLTTLATLNGPNGARWTEGHDDLSPISVWLGAMSTVVGYSTFGSQPMFDTGTTLLENSSLALPVMFTSEGLSYYTAWSQDNLTNFITTAASALTMVLPRSWQLNATGNVTVESSLGMPRLDSERSYLLLLPIGVAVLSVGLMTMLSYLMHRQSNVSIFQMAGVSEIVASTQTQDFLNRTEAVRRDGHSSTSFESAGLRYGVRADGVPVLGRPETFQAFPRH